MKKIMKWVKVNFILALMVVLLALGGIARAAGVDDVVLETNEDGEILIHLQNGTYDDLSALRTTTKKAGGFFGIRSIYV